MKIIYTNKQGDEIELEEALSGICDNIVDCTRQSSAVHAKLSQRINTQDTIIEKLKEETQYLSQRIIHLEEQQKEDHMSIWEQIRNLFKNKRISNIRTSEVDLRRE